ncbi:MAG TPA: ABC transporter substrate-binding protein [Chitinispirillaceae bacterium]|nr:ABC transporter substrate-binding protein [Chitinispirillaceae bacterium]
MLKPSIKIRLFAQFIFPFFFLIIIASCNSGKKVKITQNKKVITQDVDLPREKTLYIGGFQWGAPSSFNPLAVTPAWPVTGNVNLMYEAMFGFNQLDGKLYGILGESYEMDSSRILIKLNKMAQWSNGDPLTSEDVVYTFQCHRRYTTNYSLVWNYVDSVYADGKYAIGIILSKKKYNPLIVQDVIAGLPILPARIFSDLEKSAFESAGERSVAPDNNEIINKLREFKNDSGIVISGPYTLYAYTDQKIVLERRDDYWGKVLHEGRLPSPQYIVHTSFPSNNDYNQALQEGNLDLSSTFFPEIWKTFDKGISTWYTEKPFYIPGAIPALFMGLSVAPFDDPSFRVAVAHAIDYEKIRTDAMYGYSPRLCAGFILPFGPEKKFYIEEDMNKFGSLYDPDAAKKILKQAGYSWGPDKMLVDPEGKKIRMLSIQCPQGWSDWEATIRIIVEGLRAVGIDARERFVSYSDWDDNLKRGLFDFSMKTPYPDQTASLPWSRFEQVMNSNEIVPIGEVAFRNEGRYRNPQADNLLQQIPAATDSEKLKSLYRQLNQLFISEMPVIPLMYRPWLFYQFSTKHWNNYPVASNAYAPPQCLMVGAGIQALWGIASVSE